MKKQLPAILCCGLCMISNAIVAVPRGELIGVCERSSTCDYYYYHPSATNTTYYYTSQTCHKVGSNCPSNASENCSSLSGKSTTYESINALCEYIDDHECNVNLTFRNECSDLHYRHLSSVTH